jgi:hypothetical protein
MKEKLKKLLVISPLTITIAITFVIVVLFFANPPFLHFMELKTLNLRMVSRGQVAPAGPVVIVTVDEKSLSELGRWPWPRTTIARLIDKLKQDGAKAVGFDIVFAEPDENSSLRALGALERELKGSASPAVMKTIFVSGIRAFLTSSMFSTAACLPISGLFPAPRPSVRDDPSWTLLFTGLDESACESVLHTMKSTSWMPSLNI